MLNQTVMISELNIIVDVVFFSDQGLGCDHIQKLLLASHPSRKDSFKRMQNNF